MSQSDATSLKRVRYRRGQPLRTSDFVDEQTYHRALHRLHLTEVHTPGIVHGLRLSFDSERSRFVLQRGDAIGNDGTLIRLTDDRTFDVRAFDERSAGDELGVFLSYRTAPAATARDGSYAGCGGDGITPASREENKAVVTLGPLDGRGDSPPDPNAVQLGRLVRDLTKPPPERYRVNLTGAQYAGVRAGSVKAPSRDADLEVGPQSDARDLRLAVRLNPDAPEKPTRVIAIDKSGRIQVEGSLTVNGNVAIDDGVLHLKQASIQDGESPSAAWTISTITVAQDAKPDDEQGTSGRAVNQLLVRLPNDGEFVVGAWSEKDNKFVPVLTVRGGTEEKPAVVRIDGDLEVQGAINRPSEPAALSEPARAQLYSGVLLGPQDAGALLQAFMALRFFPGSFEEALKDEDGRSRLVKAIIAAAQAQDIVARLLENGKVADVAGAVIAQKATADLIGELRQIDVKPVRNAVFDEETFKELTKSLTAAQKLRLVEAINDDENFPPDKLKALAKSVIRLKPAELAAAIIKAADDAGLGDYPTKLKDEL